VKAGKTRILIGADARVIDALVRVAPERYADIVARLIAVAERRRR
jgi:hypothetical protein